MSIRISGTKLRCQSESCCQEPNDPFRTRRPDDLAFVREPLVTMALLSTSAVTESDE
jgi:hypothetical protein